MPNHVVKDVLFDVHKGILLLSLYQMQLSEREFL